VRITWISGWGVDPLRWQTAALRWRPRDSHAFLSPRAGAAEAAASSDVVIAWSFGAWRVLAAASRGLVFQGRVVLLAPFVAFCAEHGCGGKCAQAQVRWLRRWLSRDAPAALADFHQRAGLGDPPAGIPDSLDNLFEGLDRLAEDASPALRRFAASGLPPAWTAVVGNQDALLDGEAVCRTLPGCRIVPGATHAPETLLPPVKESVRAL